GGGVADVTRTLTVGVLAARAGTAATTADGSVDEIGGALLQAGDTVTEHLDPAGGLVPEDEGRRQQAGRVRGELMEETHIGVAGAGTGDLEEHLARAGSGIIDLLEHREGLEVLEHNGTHGAS